MADDDLPVLGELIVSFREGCEACLCEAKLLPRVIM